jgi:hypothetical protein
MVIHNEGSFFKDLRQLTTVSKPSVDKISELIDNNRLILSQDSNRRLAHSLLHPIFIDSLRDSSPQERSLLFKIHSATTPVFNRSDAIPHWKDAPESLWEIEQYRQLLLKDPQFTENFDFTSENSYLGRGREGIVYLARSKESGKLVAIKVRCERDPAVHPYNGEEEVEAVNLFQKATGYAFEARNFANFNSKDFIEGKNLQQLLAANEFFQNDDKRSFMLLKLQELFSKLIESKLYFADIAPENFIFDGNNFYMIDLRPYHICESESDARENFKQSVVGDPNSPGSISWLQDRWYSSQCSQTNREEFVKFITNVFIS